MSKHKITVSCVEGLDMVAQMNASISLSNLLSTLKKEYKLENVKSAGGKMCCFSISDEEAGITPDSLRGEIEKILDSGDFNIKIEPEDETEENNEKNIEEDIEGFTEEQTEESAEKNVSGDEKSRTHTIETDRMDAHVLIGAEEFKALVDELCDMGDALSAMKGFFVGNTYLFSIDDGCGLTTALTIFAGLTFRLGLAQRDTVAEYKGLIDTKDPAEFNGMMESFVRWLNRVGSAGVICVDLSKCCDAILRPDYREVLRMVSEVKDCIVVFRIPFVESHAQKSIIETLSDLFYVHAITFDPFTNEELFTAAREKAKKYQVEIDDDMLTIVTDMIMREKSDGRFYGIKTMEKIVTQLIYEKIRMQTGEKGRLCAADYSGLIDDETENSGESAEEKLHALVGMENVAKQIDEIISLVEYAKENGHDSPGLHMRFVGPPGTGKTTVARLVAQIMKEHGILRTGVFCEHNGNDLIAKYVGHTATKTEQICRDAYGGVLFIDEAYSLAFSENGGGGSFREEAINTLLSQMENHRDDMIVIMAGYENEIDKLMNSNPGLVLRMPYVVRFENYKREELAQIFFGFAEKKFKISEETKEHIRQYFEELPDNIYYAPNFANARFVRNIYERTLSKAALRLRLEKTGKDEILSSDFDKATADIASTMTESMVYGKNKSGAVMFSREDSSVRFADVCGEDEAKELLAEMIDFIKSPDKYREIGATIPKGALLVGPPGTGKTMLARAAATEANVPVLSISGSDLVSTYIGGGAEKIRDLFAQARKMSPCIIFIDEIDAIGMSRSHGAEATTLIQLLTEMDGFGSDIPVIVLAATNRPEALDPALRRPGRFDREIPVELPTLEGRMEILNHYLKKTKAEENINLREVSNMAAGMAGADLKNVVNEAALMALREKRNHISQRDLEESIEIVAVGYKKKGKLLNEHDKSVTCYHEIGHALAMALMTHSAPVKKITVLPRTGGTLGYAMQVDEEERFMYTKTELENRILTCVAGRAAEEVHFNEVTTGASNDIEKATHLARMLVTRYGMTEEFDMVSLESTTGGYLGSQSRMNCSDATARLVDEKVSEIVQEQHRKAIELLRTNEAKLDELAGYLYEHETITGDEFMQILNR